LLLDQEKIGRKKKRQPHAIAKFHRVKIISGRKNFGGKKKGVCQKRRKGGTRYQEPRSMYGRGRGNKGRKGADGERPFSAIIRTKVLALEDNTHSWKKS